jgi:hypothetical protein
LRAYAYEAVYRYVDGKADEGRREQREQGDEYAHLDFDALPHAASFREMQSILDGGIPLSPIQAAQSRASGMGLRRREIGGVGLAHGPTRAKSATVGRGVAVSPRDDAQGDRKGKEGEWVLREGDHGLSKAVAAM